MPSSPQYVYIPNLVGRQMLRMPVSSNVPDYDESTQSTSPPKQRSTSSMAVPRVASRSPSVASVASVEQPE